MKCHHEKECYNYPEKCEECGQLSDVRNHYPRLQTKDLVEVVRCKDCKYYDRGICYYPAVRYVAHDADHYCGYGERREQ